MGTCEEKVRAERWNLPVFRNGMHATIRTGTRGLPSAWPLRLWNMVFRMMYCQT